jgi:processive 1,2-diacylglycerol beta-glucosyltransferase
VETVDSYRYAASVFSKVVADGYLSMVKTVPQLYGMIYDRVERAERIPAARRFVSRYAATNLRAYIARTKPDLVACTHAFPCGVMSEYKAQFDERLPVVGIVTDFVVHRYWIYPNVDAYAVATPEMGAALRANGVAAGRIDVSGIPVDARFARPRSSVSHLRAELGLPLDRPVVLVMGGGLGIGPVEAAIDALARVRVPVAAAVIAGRNPSLERRVRERAAACGIDVVVRGFVDNVHDYMHASDLLITKPGGLTTSEALAARLPMLLVKPLPGQEERNTRYLVDRKAARLCRTRAELVERLERALSDPDGIAEVAPGADDVRRPEAASAVAERMLSLLERRAAMSVGSSA